MDNNNSIPLINLDWLYEDENSCYAQEYERESDDNDSDSE